MRLSGIQALGLGLWPWLCGASNWAQTTGQPAQDNVIPRIPNPDIVSASSADNPGNNDHWSNRQGMATVVVPFNASTGRLGSVFVFGGNSHIRDSQFWEAGGGYMNDVWLTNGISWKTVYDIDDKVRLGQGRGRG
jgi:hypothetical protein